MGTKIMASIVIALCILLMTANAIVNYKQSVVIVGLASTVAQLNNQLEEIEEYAYGLEGHFTSKFKFFDCTFKDQPELRQVIYDHLVEQEFQKISEGQSATSHKQ